MLGKEFSLYGKVPCRSNQRVLQKQTYVGAMISETEAILLRQRKNFQFLGFLLKQGEKYLNNTVLGVVG